LTFVSLSPKIEAEVAKSLCGSPDNPEQFLAFGETQQTFSDFSRMH
jgi:hypothetical protein